MPTSVKQGSGFCRGLELYKQGEFVAAAAAAEAGLCGNPDDGHLWQLLGMARRMLGEMDGALAALESASALAPLHPAAEFALAECYGRSGQTDLARLMFVHLATRGRCPTPLMPSLATVLGQLNEHGPALEVCRELSERQPTWHEPLFGMAFYMTRLGYPKESIVPVVERAVESAPDRVEYRVLLASLLTELGRADEACELVCDVSPRAVHCVCCVRRMTAIFARCGDERRRRAWEESARAIDAEFDLDPRID